MSRGAHLPHDALNTLLTAPLIGVVILTELGWSWSKSYKLQGGDWGEGEGGHRTTLALLSVYKYKMKIRPYKTKYLISEQNIL